MDGRKRPREEEDAGTEGGEISLSIEETNKLRISLGLKPLDLSAGKKEDESFKRHQDEQAKKAKEERAKQFLAKQAEKKRQHREDAFLDVKGLGEPDEDDDMQTWVEKTRVADVARKAEEAYAKRQEAAERARKAAAGSDDEAPEGGDGGYSAADLAGMKVRHGYDELGEGETMVLTLADKGILEEGGRGLNEAEDEELINVLKFEDKKRQKARDAAAPKAKPLWEEDGIKRGLLDKYDEEEQDLALQLGADGALAAAEAKRKEEVRKKLADAGRMLDSAAVGVLAPANPAGAAGTSGSDYYTEQELAEKQQGFKKRDKKKKKERKLREKVADEDEEGTASLIEQLEAQAEQHGASALSDLGTRDARLTARERATAELRAQEASKRAKFEAAVAKGNWASLALKPSAQAESTTSLVVGEEDLEDRELQESLERARRMALSKAKAQESKAESKVKTDPDSMDVDSGAGAAAGESRTLSTVEEIAAKAAKAREEEEARLKQELAEAAKLGKDRVVNDTMEFVRNIQVAPGSGVGAGASGIASVMGTSSRVPPPPPGAPRGQQGPGRLHGAE